MVMCSDVHGLLLPLLLPFILHWKVWELGSRGSQETNKFPAIPSSLNLSCLCNITSRQAGEMLKPGAQSRGVACSVDMALQWKESWIEIRQSGDGDCMLVEGQQYEKDRR